MEKLIMFKTIKKLWSLSWFDTIRFNFHYLPLKQAIRLPFFLYSSELICLKGAVTLNAKKISPGMIKFGHCGVLLYAQEKFCFANKGGIVFNGPAYIGNGSAIRCYPGAELFFGNSFVASAKCKIECFQKISFDEWTRIAWDVVLMDSSSHRIKNADGNFIGKDASPIEFGRNCWIGTRSIILKGTRLSNFCIVGANSVLNKDYRGFGEKILISSESKVVKKKEGIWRNPEDPRDNISEDYWNS